MKPYTVALSIYIKPDGDLGLFENGLKQNVIFLHKLFKHSPNCKRAVLLHCGEAEPVIPPWLDLDPADIVRPGTLSDIDYLIGVGAAINREIVQDVKALGGKVIAYKGGNDAVLGMEALAARPEPSPGAPAYFDYDCFDAVWLTPQHTRTNKKWCELVYRCPVYEVPQVWSPMILNAMKPPSFGYKPGPRPWKVGVMEPNNTVMKTSYWPMLACEAAWRKEPERFAAFLITNAIQFMDNPAFKSLALTLSAAKTPKPDGSSSIMSFEKRFAAAEFLGNHCDAVVTHHWENELNYLYYDVLYGGYPLIHNSDALRDYGYYYESFDPYAGAQALLDAWHYHDHMKLSHTRDNARLFDTLAPTSHALIHTHEELLSRCADASGNALRH